MFMEHLKGGNLAEYVTLQGGRINEEDARYVMREVFSAI